MCIDSCLRFAAFIYLCVMLDVFLSCLQVLRGLAYLREKHQIMHRGKQYITLLSKSLLQQFQVTAAQETLSV